jgi:hypothetical protein
VAIRFSDFTFVPDVSSSAATSRGDGAVLVPISAFGCVVPPSVISVVDLQDRSVVFDGGGQVYFTDSGAGTKDFVGWSYWESDATDASGATPCVNLLVLSPDYDEANYPGVS